VPQVIADFRAAVGAGGKEGALQYKTGSSAAQAK